MTLKECESQISAINKKINGLLTEREKVLKKWHIAFQSENKEHIFCEDEFSGQLHKLYLINGNSRLFVCDLWEDELTEDTHKLYQKIDHSMELHNFINHQSEKKEYPIIPDWQKNLVYTKVMEIRDLKKIT